MRKLGALLLVLLCLGCASGGSPYFQMPGPRSGGFVVTVWNEGLDVLHVAVTNSEGEAESGRYTIMSGEHRTLQIYGQRGHRILYETGGQQYITMVQFTPDADLPCWGMVVGTTPNLDVVNPLPMECR